MSEEKPKILTVTTDPLRRGRWKQLTAPLRRGELDYIVVTAHGEAQFELHPPRIEDVKLPEIKA